MSMWQKVFGKVFAVKSKSARAAENPPQAPAAGDATKELLKNTSEFQLIRALPLNQDKKAALISELLLQWATGKSRPNSSDRTLQLKWYIQVAVRKVRDVETVRCLLAAGADKEAWDDGGFSILHRAAGQNDPEIVEALIHGGANKDERIKNDKYPGMTPLHIAATMGHASVVETLVRAGADLKAIDHELKLNPLGWAELRGHSSVATILRKASTDQRLL